jgi:nucleoside-diphosphate-sugar epimerase
MRALVTGGGGFLGGAILRRLLADGHEVVSLARGDYPELRALGAETVRVDLADSHRVIEAADGCDVVFHVAAKAGVWGTEQEFYNANVKGTSSVLAACHAHGIGRLVYTSTPSVIHAGGDIEGGDNTLPYPAHFEAPYPATKAIAERAVLSANCPELATVAIRPHLIWGPGDTNLGPRIVARSQAGRLRLVRAPGKLVDACYIDNAVDAHLLAAERLAPGAPCAGSAYFVTNDEPVAAAELINGILQAAGEPPCERYLPAGLAYAAGWLMELAWRLFRLDDEPPMTRFLAKQLATSHHYDLGATREDLGWEPRVSTAEGLERLAAWYGSQRAEGPTAR